jgi:hypothetical protein
MQVELVGGQIFMIESKCPIGESYRVFPRASSDAKINSDDTLETI